MRKLIAIIFLLNCWIVYPQVVSLNSELPSGYSSRIKKELINQTPELLGKKYNLTLQDAINLAMEQNRDILISQQDVQKSEAQISEAYGNAFPQIDFSAGYMRNIKLPVLFIPPNTPFNESNKTLQFEMGANNSYTTSLSLNQVLFSAKVNTAIQIAKEYRNYSNYNAQSTFDEVRFSVKQMYYGVLLSKKVVEVNHESYNLIKAHYENIKKLFDKGVAAEFDLLRAEVQVANTEPALSQAENNLVLAMNGLKNILGLNLDDDIQLLSSLEMDELSAEIISGESKAALERNSNILGLIAMERMYDKNIQIQKADYYPTIAAYGVYQYQTQDNTFKFSDYSWAKSFYVGLQVSYPIFNGLQTIYRTEQAYIDKEKVVLNRIKLEEGIKIQVEAATLKMQEAKKRVEAQSKSVEQAQRALKIAEVRYENGVGTQLELFDSQVALTATQINRVQAVYDYLVARAEWEKNSGYTENIYKEKR